MNQRRVGSLTSRGGIKQPALEMIRRSCYSRYRTRLDWMAPRSTPKTPCSRAPIKLIFELGVDSGYTNDFSKKQPLPGSGRRSRGECYLSTTARTPPALARLHEIIATCQTGGISSRTGALEFFLLDRDVHLSPKLLQAHHVIIYLHNFRKNNNLYKKSEFSSNCTIFNR